MSKSGRGAGVSVEPAGADVAAVGRFEKALDLLHRERWEEAEKAFAQVAEGDPSSPIAERSRMYRAVCRAKLVGPPPADEDLYLAAVVAKNAGDLDTAIEISNRGGLKGRDARFAYLAAAVENLRGNRDESLRLLEKAIEMDPKNRVRAFWDPDFAELRKNPDGAALFQVAR